MRQVLIKEGQVTVVEVPPPVVEAGSLLVAVDHSCISAGTEMSGLRASALPLWKRALKNPKAVKSALKMVADKGIAHTRNVIKGSLSSGRPTGYSAAGTVMEIGAGVDDICPGDRVACAGAKYANHADIICVPRNLCVKLPQTLDFPLASTVTLGAIALQGVRRAGPTLGETFAVIGLGILGQITTQILRVNGCRVVGTDVLPARIKLAKQLGMNHGIFPNEDDPVATMMRLTNGLGADAVIITASTPSNDVVATAFNMCRKKGRVVLVGDVGLNLKREDFYAKELDFLISTSYGPGRYDENYEEKGNDYPPGYVRWTENRNMGEYLRMIAENKIQISPLINATYELNKAGLAYGSLNNNSDPSLMALLSYKGGNKDRLAKSVIANVMAKGAGKDQIRLALIGAGGFAKGTHLPNLEEMKDIFHIRMVASKTGYNAANVAKQYGAEFSTTDYEEVINDENVDAVMITTRHNLHADMTIRALSKGKHVFVEKPLALTAEELEAIKNFYQSAQTGSCLPVLLTGFNRRFSPFAIKLKKLVQDRKDPMIINYTMNAGFIPLDNWLQTGEGGGRNLGEACHIYDLFTFLTESSVASIQANSITTQSSSFSQSDNFTVTIKFSDGSLATLTYTAMGSKKFPKERMEVFFEGKVAVLDDYLKLTVSGAKENDLSTKLADKGHKHMLRLFGDTIQNGGDWPIPFWQQIQATEIALAVEKQLTKINQ